MRGGSLTTLTACLNPGDSAPVDATTADYQACVSGSFTTLTACLNPGAAAPVDATTAAQQWCDSGTTRSRNVCVDRATARRAMCRAARARAASG